jgi:LemA protein
LNPKGVAAHVLEKLENPKEAQNPDDFEEASDAHKLEGTENRIAFARSNYIEAISKYNVSLKVFPMQLFTKPLGLEPKVNYFKDYVSLLNAPG